ncbi:chromatin associated protein KTI12 [Myriangium duriaei CBS 260.36]|uniref:Chromatin associated protein KTI12 n=1 Tax=Myriangium duriaei CBS 260.36 TaxID=1168546 RepID=A0A9P4J5W0_9PEZI|nr:chromatin associated protein KTI12 [Myriangium duriaei CBS 260.36]
MPVRPLLFVLSSPCPLTPIPHQLILLSGLPTSGKTQRTQQIQADFSSRISSSTDPHIRSLRIVHISDSSLGLSRTVYDAGRAEKDARAAFSSAVKRELTRETIVLADGMNYIKGFRYQLYCEAKAVRTTSCVVQPAVPPAVAREWNEKALAEGSGGYDKELWENLVFRHEEPNGMNRWDAPLFVVPYDDEHPPYEEIWDALVGKPGERKEVRPNAATVLKKGAESGYLAFLERVCGEVVKEVEEWGRENGGQGGSVEIRCSDVVQGREGPVVVEVPVDGVKGPQLQRLRRQFVAQNRVNEIDKRRVGGLFVDYLNDAFQD